MHDPHPDDSLANQVDKRLGEPSEPGEQNRSGGLPRFGLFTLMLLTVVFCVMAAAASYLLRGLRSGTSPKAVFIIFTLAAPMLLMVALSLTRAAVRWLDRRR